MDGNKSDYTIKTMTLRELLDDDSLRVPRFHGNRGYAWTMKQKSEYLNDILSGNYPGTVMLTHDGDKKYLIDFCQRYEILRQVDSDWDNWAMTDKLFAEKLLSIIEEFYPDVSDFDRVLSAKKIVSKYINDEDTRRSLPYDVMQTLGTADRELFSELCKQCQELSDAFDNRIVADKLSFSDIQVPVVEFISMEAALNSYVKMNMGSRALSESDLQRVYWDTCTIKIPETEAGDCILRALNEYYRMMAKKAGEESDDWLSYDTLSERINSDGSIKEVPREFYYESGLEIITSRTISLYELCCALGFVFYDAVPQFAIEDKTSARMADYQASKSGIIFLAPIFSLSPNSNQIITELGNSIHLITQSESVEENLAILVECIRNFGETFSNEYANSVFSSITPSAEVFEPLLALMFQGEWESKYRLEENNIVKTECQNNPWEHLLRILFEIIVITSLTHCLTKQNAERIRLRYRTFLKTINSHESFAEKVQKIHNLNIIFDDLIECVKQNDISKAVAYTRNFNVLYAMFHIFECGNENVECYEFGSIFEAETCNAVLGRTSRHDKIDFGNMFFRPVYSPSEALKEDNRKPLPIKDNQSLVKQIDKTDGLLTEQMLKDLKYPGAEAVAARGKGRPKKEEKGMWKNDVDFEQIRTSLLKERPKLYREYVEGREKYIIETLIEKIEL